MWEPCSIYEQSRSLLYLRFILPNVTQDTKYTAFWGHFNKTFATVICKFVISLCVCVCVAEIQWFDNLNQITSVVLLHGIFAY